MSAVSRRFTEMFAPPPQVRLTRLGSIARKAVGWLWPGRVPLGKVTLLVGDPGRGKSLMALDMAARVTNGLPWPDEGGARVGGRGSREEGRGSREEGRGSREEGRGEAGDGAGGVGSVVLLSAEDDAADTIRPRLEAAGGDPHRVVILRSVRRPGCGREGELEFSLSRDVEVLEAVIGELGDVRLVVMDPVSAYLSGAPSHSNEGMREVLAPLRAVAERTGVAVVAISHLTKRHEATMLYRAMGSLALVAAARAVWAVGPDREAAGRLLFVPVKCNLVGGVAGLAYRIVPSPEDPAVPRLEWEGEPLALTAQEAFGMADATTRLERAMAWLEGVLAAGPVAVREVERRAGEAGIAPVTLRRAKRLLRVRAYHRGFGSGWVWGLPGADLAVFEGKSGD